MTTIKFILAIALLIANIYPQAVQADESKQQCLLEISGDWTKFDSTSGIYSAKRNAEAHVVNQNASVRADWIEYDSVKKIIDAKGHVSILRNGVISRGARFKFRASSDEYIVTNSQCVVGGVELAEGKLPIEPKINSTWENFYPSKPKQNAASDAKQVK